VGESLARGTDPGPTGAPLPAGMGLGLPGGDPGAARLLQNGKLGGPAETLYQAAAAPCCANASMPGAGELKARPRIAGNPEGRRPRVEPAGAQPAGLPLARLTI